MAEVPAAFKTAPAEVLRYFREKRAQPTFDWRDIAPQEHAFSWTFAKTSGFDVLDDVRKAVDDAITNRVPFEIFKTQLTSILQQKGWWGKKLAQDPASGELKEVQLGSPRRLKTIYWANVRTAHAAGEWERTQRTKDFLPYLIYTLSQAERRRPEHEGWVGTVLPVDDPWWETHYPPNGWGCKCGVRQIARREAERNGYDPKTPTPAPPVDLQPWQNKRTGKVDQVPHGIDPGWANNPGKARADNVAQFVTGKVEAMPPAKASMAVADIVQSPVLEAMVAGKMPPKFYMPIAQVGADVAEAFGAKSRTVRLSVSSVDHIIKHPEGRGLKGDDFRQAIEVIVAGKDVLISGQQNNAAVFYGETEKGWWRAVAKYIPHADEWWLLSLHKSSGSSFLNKLLPAWRKGNLLKSNLSADEIKAIESNKGRR